MKQDLKKKKTRSSIRSISTRAFPSLRASIRVSKSSPVEIGSCSCRIRSKEREIRARKRVKSGIRFVIRFDVDDDLDERLAKTRKDEGAHVCSPPRRGARRPASERQDEQWRQQHGNRQSPPAVDSETGRRERGLHVRGRGRLFSFSFERSPTSSASLGRSDGRRDGNGGRGGGRRRYLGSLRRLSDGRSCREGDGAFDRRRRWERWCRRSERRARRRSGREVKRGDVPVSSSTCNL